MYRVLDYRKYGNGECQRAWDFRYFISANLDTYDLQQFVLQWCNLRDDSSLGIIQSADWHDETMVHLIFSQADLWSNGSSDIQEGRGPITGRF